MNTETYLSAFHKCEDELATINGYMASTIFDRQPHVMAERARLRKWELRRGRFYNRLVRRLNKLEKAGVIGPVW